MGSLLEVVVLHLKTNQLVNIFSLTSDVVESFLAARGTLGRVPGAVFGQLFKKLLYLSEWNGIVQHE